MEYILSMMKKFGAKHRLHIDIYGDGNQDRLTGTHETANIDTFTFGVGNRAASFRIPTQVAHDDGKGYIEDRRPASNIDPYVVASMIFDTSVLDVTKATPLL